MSDERHEPGWWLGADGRWHPPGARAAPPATARPPRPQPTGPIDPVPGINPGNWQRATPLPDATQSRVPSSVRPSAPVATPAAAGPAPGLGVPGFDDNPFTGQRRRSGRTPPMLGKRGRLVLPLKVLLVLVVAAGVAAGAFILTHPSPRRSPDAAAMDFYQQLEKGQWASALKDVAPDQRATASGMRALPEVMKFRTSLADFSNLQLANGGPPTATTKSVQIQGCGADFSCTSLLAVPTLEVKGSWYVDFTTWDQTLVTDKL